MRLFWRIAPSTLLALALSACGSSPPLRYYALDAVTPVGAPAHSGSIAVRVRHISLPAEMDHRGLTHHLGPNQVTVSDAEQWSAPLGNLIQGTLTRDLGLRLGFDHVVAPGALAAGSQPDPSQASLDLDFVQLTADENCGVTAQANWTVVLPGGLVRRGSVHSTTAATSSCPAGLPAALSAALGDLADQLIQHFP